MWGTPTVNGKLRSQFSGEQIFAGDDRHVSTWRLPVAMEKSRIEAILRRAIPVLIIMFLICVALTRGFSLLSSHVRMEAAVLHSTEAVAALAALALDEQTALTSKPDQQAATIILEDTLTEIGMGGETDLVLVNSSGVVFAATGQARSFIGRTLSGAFPGLMVPHAAGEEKDASEISFQGTSYQVVPRLVGDDGSLIIAMHSLQNMHSLWRAEINLNVTLFAATAVLLLVVLYAYYAQLAKNGSIVDEVSAESEKRGLMLANGETGLWAFSPENRSAWLDSSAAAVLGEGIKAGYYSYRFLLERIHPEDRIGLAHHLHPSAEGLVQHSLRLRQHDGRYARFELRAHASMKNGVMTLAGAAIRACEVHHRERHALHEAAQLKSVFDALPHALALWKPDGKLLTANKSFCDVHDLQPARIDTLCRSDVEKSDSTEQQLVRRSVCEGSADCEIKTADGRWLRVSEICIASGETLVIGMDITDFKACQIRLQAEQVRLRDKVNNLAASRRALEQETAALTLSLKHSHARGKEGLAENALTRHSADLRTSLTAILGFSELLLVETESAKVSSGKVTEYAKCIRDGGNRLKALAETLEAEADLKCDHTPGVIIRRQAAAGQSSV